MSLGLTPARHLRWAPRDGDPVPPAFARLQAAFDADWREALFTLAAERIDTHETPALRFWQEISERHLTALCHLPEHETNIQVEPPTAADCAGWILSAPPMHGGEYLSEDSLQGVWSHLDAWVREAVGTTTGGLPAFLRARAPSWHQVGRVCFHLAENRNDQERPFAFMATYASGFGASGRVKHLPLRRALQQYAGAKNRAALIALLSPIQQAAETCDWVRELVDSGDVYQPLAWTPDRAYRLLRSVPALEASGLSVRLPNWWRKRPRPQVSVTIGGATPSMVGADALVDFDVGVALGGESLSRAELETLLDGDGELMLLKGQWVEVDRDRLREAIEHWEAVRQIWPATTASPSSRECACSPARRPISATRIGRRPNAPGCTSKPATPCARSSPGCGSRTRSTRWRSAARCKGPRCGRISATAWHGSRLLTTLGLGACLADDMGLGKTIQVLALLLGDRRARVRPRRRRRCWSFRPPCSETGAARPRVSRRRWPCSSCTRPKPIGRRWRTIAAAPGAAPGRRRSGGDDVRHAAAATLAGGGAVAAGDPGRSPGHQEPGHAPEPGGARSCRPAPASP